MTSKEMINKKLLNLDKYKQKHVDVEQAIKRYIKPGDRIFIDSGCSEPIDLISKLIELGPQLSDVEMIHFISLSDLDYYKSVGGNEDLFRHNVFFISENLRDSVRRGFADYTPMLLSDIPRFFERGQMHLKTALIQISPPDEFGFCSYGINVDIAKPIAEGAEFVIAEINPKMPRTLGDSFIHMNDIDAYILSDHDIIEFKYDPPDESIKKIAKYVASLIEDESTIQMGIGKIPNAISTELEDKKDLGVHSEVFSDGIVDLVEKGVITCKKKTLHKGKIVTSFVMGSRRLYDFVDNNPFVEFHPSNYCNDPFVISRNKKQVAINAALTIDLTGQINADSLGTLFYSGIGGQVDFVRGANHSEDGKPIAVLASTATLKDGTVVSRIVPYLQPGSGVVITRGDIHYVVSEWGIAYLFGKSIRERVLQMINIAHPDFREELLEYAKKVKYIYADQKLPISISGRLSLYPDKYETTFQMKNGEILKIRPIKPTDERMLQKFYYSLSDLDKYLRFFSRDRNFSHKFVQPLANIDYTTDMVLVSECLEGGERIIVASAAFFKTHKPSTVELGIVVKKNFRRTGIATFLLNYLVIIARELNYQFFTGSILVENKPMLHFLNNSGFPLKSKSVEYGEVLFTLDISK
ncbi:MAG: GNAT family N-acetyltransferase [Candidatus Lokiarchaeota archaeon]|nr:GNAT family N-acetyltransferase [Candidatus Lokiarchaeota archaeon]